MLARAAQNEHWATVVCHSAEEALRQAARQKIQLALVDLQSAQGEQADGLRRLVEQLAARHLLLAICGLADDPAGEIWSRKLGVWTYLPGIDSQSDVALVCAEARNAIDKMNGRLSPARA
jgi:ActR/RegA family two-component response regulator